MQPSFSGNACSSPKEARLPGAQIGAFTKPYVAPDDIEKPSSHNKDVAESYNDDESAGSSSTQANENAKRLSISYAPRTKAVSPYSPKSERADVILQELIHYYTTFVTKETVTPVGPRHEWFPFAAVDEALFHAAMSHTAAHLAYRRKVPLHNVPEYYWHTGQAIRLVNARLGEGLYKAATEGTICAICCLTQLQAFGGLVADTRVHLNGLIQLVQAAGGLQSVNMNPKVRRLVLLTDLASSITLSQKFYLEPTLQLCDLSLYFGPASSATESYARNFSTRLYNFSESAELSNQALTLFWGLRNLSLLLEDIRAGRESPDTPHAEDLQFTDRVEILERYAHSLWYNDPTTSPTSFGPDETHLPPLSGPNQPPPRPSSNAKTTVFRLLGHATLIYIYTVLRELPPELGMLKLVASRIMSELEKCPYQNVLLATFQDLLVWVMFLGGSVAGPREKSYLARMVSKILLVNKIEQEKDIITASHRFLWPEVEEGLEVSIGE